MPITSFRRRGLHYSMGLHLRCFIWEWLRSLLRKVGLSRLTSWSEGGLVGTSLTIKCTGTDTKVDIVGWEALRLKEAAEWRECSRSYWFYPGEDGSSRLQHQMELLFSIREGLQLMLNDYSLHSTQIVATSILLPHNLLVLFDFLNDKTTNPKRRSLGHTLRCSESSGVRTHHRSTFSPLDTSPSDQLDCPWSSPNKHP